MGLIRSGALRGWGRLWGTEENRDPPLRIDGSSQVQPVYDVGPAAHWQSPHLFNGWVWLKFITTKAGMGAAQVSVELDLDEALPALIGTTPLAAEQLHDSRPWLCDAQLVDETGTGTITSWSLWMDTSSIQPQGGVASWFLARGADTFAFDDVNGDEVIPSSGAGQNAPLNLRAIRVPQACPLTALVDYSGAGAGSVRVLIWLAADGAPPPGYS